MEAELGDPVTLKLEPGDIPGLKSDGMFEYEHGVGALVTDDSDEFDVTKTRSVDTGALLRGGPIGFAARTPHYGAIRFDPEARGLTL